MHRPSAQGSDLNPIKQKEEAILSEVCLCQIPFILKIHIIILFGLVTYLQKSKAKCSKTWECED